MRSSIYTASYEVMGGGPAAVRRPIANHKIAPISGTSVVMMIHTATAAPGSLALRYLDERDYPEHQGHDY